MPKKSPEFYLREEGFKNSADWAENATWQDIALEVEEEANQKAKEALRLKEEQELLESRETALAKLELLQDPEFKDFGIRYVNLAEYEEILRSGSFRAREINVPKFWNDDGWVSSFQEFMERSKESWIASADRQTNWGSSTLGLRLYNRTINLLKRAHREIENKSDRRAIIRRFRDLLVAEAGEVNPDMFERMSLRVISRRSHLQIVKDFLANPESFEAPEKLRMFIRAICEQPVERRGDLQLQQYQLALIVSLEAVGIGEDDDYSGGNPSWRFLKSQVRGRESGPCLLGAVAIMPEKSIVERVVELSRRAGILAHPVFNHSGLVRYPR